MQSKPIKNTGMQDEKRAFPRKPFLTPVDYATPDRLYQEYIFDISAGGAYIETRHPLAVGREIALSFSLPAGSAAIKIDARVVRNDNKGIGVAFQSQDTGIQRAIVEMVAAL